MKQVLILLVLIGLMACNSSNSSNGTPFDLTGYENEKISGTSITYVFKKDNTGKMVEEGFIRDGLKDGQWITYDPAKGSIKSIESYMAGTLFGYSFNVSKRGYLDDQTGYQNNELDGRVFKYRYGKPKSEFYYNKGQLEGIQIDYYDNGKIMEETEYKNGVQNGIYKYYSDDGLLRMSYIYKDGKKESGGAVENPEEAAE